MSIRKEQILQTRIEVEKAKQFIKIAKSNNTTTSKILRQFIEEYITNHQ